jgi:hypothetical protein
MSRSIARDTSRDSSTEEVTANRSVPSSFLGFETSWILQSAILQSLWDQLSHEAQPSTFSTRDRDPMHAVVVDPTSVASSSEDANNLLSSSSSRASMRTKSVPVAPLPVQYQQKSVAVPVQDKCHIRRNNSNSYNYEQPPTPETSTASLEDYMDTDNVPPSHEPICPLWTRLTEDELHRWIRGTVVAFGTCSARNPWTTVLAVAIASFGIAITGVLTNFTMVYEHSTIFTPMNSLPALHGKWISEESGFEETNDMIMIIHAHGENVLQVPAVLKAFEALDTVRNAQGYDELCAQSSYINAETREPTCWVWSVTELWKHNRTLFEQAFVDRGANASTLGLVEAVSQSSTEDGFPIFHEFILGAFEKELVEPDNDGSDRSWFHSLKESLPSRLHHDNGTTRPPRRPPRLGFRVQQVPAFVVSVGLPPVDDSYSFQEGALADLHALQKKWIQQEGTQDNPLNLHLDFFCPYAYELEYERALNQDLPLVPTVFFVMLGFTMFVFHRYGYHDRGRGGCQSSRALLGLGSIVTIGFSLVRGEVSARWTYSALD